MDNRLERLNALNKTLNPPNDLSGVFLPAGAPKQFDVMFIAEIAFDECAQRMGQGATHPKFC